MWHKIEAGAITTSRSTLPPVGRLSDGSWVTGFPGADPEVVAAAGWVQSDDLGPRPDNGYEQTAVWTLNGDGTVTGAWVQGAAVDPPPKTAAEIAAEYATIETIADMEAFRQALEGSV